MKFVEQISIKGWTRIGVLNLLLVAVLGILMRLKFILPLPFFDLKHVQHAHSHFAFAGWVTHMLMLFIVLVTFRLQKKDNLPPHQNRILFSNLLCSLGMLFSFLYQGYGSLSISLSTGSILVSYVFAIFTWHDIRQQNLDPKIARWFYLSLIFLVLSSFGTFYLAYLKATQQSNLKGHLSALYFYLHFQYNGWFFFAIMGLVQHILNKQQALLRETDKLFYILSIATAPLYFLSILWTKPSTLAYLTIVIFAIGQFAIWIYWMIHLYAPVTRKKFADMGNYLKLIFSLLPFALFFKFFLQTLSVIPALSAYVYGFRPVIIGYLHLVLLVIMSIFLISYSYLHGYFKLSPRAKQSFTLFIIGVLLNELVLALQGFLALFTTGLPQAHIYLLIASTLIGIGLVGIIKASYNRLEKAT